jgi:hypothetical protein
MSEGTPDLSRVVSLIMENPGLIEQISGLVKSEMKEEPRAQESESQVEKSEPAVMQKETPTKEASATPFVGARQNRARLMSALKPYVSESRQKALDSFLSIADILDMMRSR